MSIVPQLIVNSIIAGSIYALVALGFNFIFGATKFFNLAHGVIAALGAYVVFFLLRYWDFGTLAAIIIGVIASGVAGYLLDRLLYRHLRSRNATNMVLLVASLGVFTAIQALLAILFTSQFQVFSSSRIAERLFHLGSVVITQTQVIIFSCAILVSLFLLILLKYTRLGRAIRAISDDIEVAKIVGINVERVIGIVFFIGSAIAGLAGILVGFDTGIEPTMGLPLLLKGVIASIVGGIGIVSGGFVGAFFLGFVENFGIWKISGEWKDAIAFGVLILFLLFRPQGIIKK